MPRGNPMPCPDCGIVKEGYGRCESCEKHYQWRRGQHCKGNIPREYDNPYTSYLDANEIGTHLTPTLDTVANRMSATAKYHERMAERGGPKGAWHAEEAAWRFRVIEKLRTSYRDNSTVKAQEFTFWVKEDAA